jgi:hypothetical protein
VQGGPTASASRPDRSIRCEKGLHDNSVATSGGPVQRSHTFCINCLDCRARREKRLRNTTMARSGSPV